MEVWPVIHIGGVEQARRNFSIATAAGCAGVMLIHMGSNSPNHQHMHDMTDAVGRELLTNPWGMKVGVNYLGVTPLSAVNRAIATGYHASWSDCQMFGNGEQMDIAGTIENRLRGTEHRLFAAVAFKGQAIDNAPERSAKDCAARCFIPTTSGPGTGHPPTVEKIKRMAMAYVNKEMAIASGLEPENIATFAPFITHALVATGISHTFYDFDPYKLRRFMEAARTR